MYVCICCFNVFVTSWQCQDTCIINWNFAIYIRAFLILATLHSFSLYFTTFHQASTKSGEERNIAMAAMLVDETKALQRIQQLKLSAHKDIHQVGTTYTCTYTCMYNIYIYAYIYAFFDAFNCMHIFIYIFIYLYIFVHLHIWLPHIEWTLQLNKSITLTSSHLCVLYIQLKMFIV